MPTINTVRIIRHSTDTIEKEVLKEYFRYLGLLFYDAPINTSTDFAEELFNPCHKADVDIILNCSKELAWIPAEYFNEVESSSIIIQTNKNQTSDKRFSINKKKSCFYKNGSDYYKDLISQLLDAIFNLRKKRYTTQIDLETSMENQMHKFLDYMFEFNIFAFMQNKHTFRVMNMSAVIDGVIMAGVNGYPYISGGNDASGKFTILTLKNLIALNNKLGKREELSGQNYLLYAKANTIRKTKEIINLLQDQPCIDDLKEVVELSFSDHLELIQDIESTAPEKKMHIGTLFLGATICQESKQFQPMAEEYYHKLIVYASTYPAGKIPVFYSFFYYQYGRYLSRFWHNNEYAAICYETAANLDSRGYQANFMLGALYNRKKQIGKAQEHLQEALKILYRGQNMDHVYNCLSIKSIPYVFKTCFLLAQISALTGRIQERNYYLWCEEKSFSEFTNIVQKIKKDYCLSEEKRETKVLFDMWNQSHHEGTTLKFLSNVLQISRQVLSQRYQPILKI